jgi:hypothetical protein
MSEMLEKFDAIVAQCNRFERKGKSMIYTSANGHMFTGLNKDEEMGVRFSKEVQEAYFKKFNTSYYISHGAKMKGYILVTENMLEDIELMVQLFHESEDYVMSLQSK